MYSLQFNQITLKCYERPDKEPIERMREGHIIKKRRKWWGSEMERWLERVAVVTGASEGIGASIVRQLASHRLRVVALARREHLLKELEKELNGKKYFVKSHVCDVSNEGSVKGAFEWIENNIGPISVLVNNAAYFQYAALTDLDNKIMKTTIDTNLTGVMQTTHYALKSMKNNNITDGHIININSVLGHTELPVKGVSVYTATKHGLTVFNSSLKRELAEEGSKIKVTSISPGLVKTTMSNWWTKEHPESPALEADDVAATVVYALSTPPNVNVIELTVEAT